MITLTEIARKLGTTEATVSNALSGKGRMTQETRDRIREAASELGYTKHLYLSKEFRQILVVSETTGSYCDEILSGITEASAKSDIFPNMLSLGIFERNLGRNPSPDRLKLLLKRLMDNLPYRPSGLIYVSQYPRKAAGIFNDIEIPVVSIRMLDSGADIDIDFDNQQGANLAVNHLYEIGKRTIATITGTVDCYSSSERLIGYQRALIDHGLEFHPRLIWSADWEKESGLLMMKKMLEYTKAPDAVFAQNDALAYGAILAAKECGLRIPDDLAVIGFDGDKSYALTNPQITTVRPPYTALGQVAFERLHGLLKGDKLLENRILLPCELILRESA